VVDKPSPRKPDNSLDSVVTGSLEDLRPGQDYHGHVVWRLLHRGGLADLYLASTTSKTGVSSAVAIKRLHPRFAVRKELREVFLQEQHRARSLRQPNVAQVLDVVDQDADLAVVLEFLHGQSLLDVARRSHLARAFIPYRLLAHVACEVLKGLEYAHGFRWPGTTRVGLVHQGVSPDNVILAYDGQVKLVGFGFSGPALSAANTTPEQLQGKLPYLPPEAIRGEPLDGRADLYALGVTMYEALTYALPFGQHGFAAREEDVQSRAVPSPRDVNPSIPPVLEAVCLKALESDRSRRVPSAAQMRGALEAYLHDEGRRIDREHIRAYMDLLVARTDPRRVALQADVDAIRSGARAPTVTDATPFLAEMAWTSSTDHQRMAATPTGVDDTASTGRLGPPEDLVTVQRAQARSDKRTSLDRVAPAPHAIPDEPTLSDGPDTVQELPVERARKLLREAAEAEATAKATADADRTTPPTPEEFEGPTAPDVSASVRAALDVARARSDAEAAALAALHAATTDEAERTNREHLGAPGRSLSMAEAEAEISAMLKSATAEFSGARVAAGTGSLAGVAWSRAATEFSLPAEVLPLANAGAARGPSRGAVDEGLVKPAPRTARSAWPRWLVPAVVGVLVGAVAMVSYWLGRLSAVP
jgi:serine/threonine-protein kinase